MDSRGGTPFETDLTRHLYELALMSYSLLPSPSTPIKRTESDGYPPLVFVHGWGGSRADFIPLSFYLRYYGRRRMFGPNFGFGDSIESRVEQLGRYLKEVIDAHEDEQIEIVAHSMGGVVTRLAIAEYGLEKRIKTLVTLGTPHGGSRAANGAWPSQVVRDLRPDSWLIQRLRHLPLPKNIRGYSLWSRNDLLITPATAAILPGTKKIECTPFTHYSYLIDREGWQTIRRVLTSSPREAVSERPFSQFVLPWRSFA
jgi:pimeloyl-ACP methyl ester carboxylesterase